MLYLVIRLAAFLLGIVAGMYSLFLFGSVGMAAAAVWFCVGFLLVFFSMVTRPV